MLRDERSRHKRIFSVAVKKADWLRSVIKQQQVIRVLFEAKEVRLYIPLFNHRTRRLKER